MSDEQTFVYDGVEVRKTGRIATKQPPISTSNRSLMTSPTAYRPKVVNITLVEIEPIDKYQDWKKWVREMELFIVEG